MLQHGEHGLPSWSGRAYPTHFEEKQGFSAWLPWEEWSHCQYTKQRIQIQSRPRSQCLSTRQNLPKSGTPGRQSAPCKSGTNCRGGMLPGICPLGQSGGLPIRFVRLGRICTHDVKIYISWILRSRWIKNMTISTTPPVLAYAVAVTNVSSPERRPTSPVIGLCNQTSTGEPVTTDGGPLRSMMCRPDDMRLFVLSFFPGQQRHRMDASQPFPTTDASAPGSVPSHFMPAPPAVGTYPWAGIRLPRWSIPRFCSFQVERHQAQSPHSVHIGPF